MYVIGLTHFCVHHQVFTHQFITEDALELVVGEKMDMGLLSIAYSLESREE